jgi:hypothetical protein
MQVVRTTEYPQYVEVTERDDDRVAVSISPQPVARNERL